MQKVSTLPQHPSFAKISPLLHYSHDSSTALFVCICFCSLADGEVKSERREGKLTAEEMQPPSSSFLPLLHTLTNVEQAYL